MSHPLLRLFSFILAVVCSAAILIYPQALTTASGRPNHGLLLLLLIAIGIGFIHGIGFSARNRLIRTLLGPLIAWPIMAAGLMFMLR